MSRYKHTKSIKNLRKLSIESILENRKNYILREELGLLMNYDKSSDYDTLNNNFITISTLYKSLNEYEMDKLKASILISEGKEIPKELYNKLAKTKIELESNAINKKFKENTKQWYEVL